MHSVSSKVAGGAIVAILAIAGALMSSKSAVADASKDVVVTPLPLPVIISGNSNANAVWTRSVNDGVQPVQAKASIGLFPGQPFSADVVLYNVGPNRRLVMEYASAICALPAGQAISLSFMTTAGGIVDNHVLQSSFPAPPGANANSSIGQPVRFYADPGTSVISYITRTDTSGSASCNLEFSGYLAPLP